MEAWEEFVEESDADGVSDFYGQQATTARGAYEGGDGLLRIRPRRPEDGLSVPLQLQCLEVEMLDSSKTMALPGGGTIKAGVECNAIGQRVAYWMHKSHPGESVGLSGIGTSVRVPAEQVIHVFHARRPGQVRGVPKLASALAMLREVTDVTDAYVLRKKIQNLYASFETTSTGASVHDDEQVEDSPTASDDGVDMVTMEPGQHQLLPMGHDIKFSDPPNDAGDHEEFMRTELRGIAVGGGVTYEQISGDLKSVNFTSIRAGLIELRRRVEQYQRNVLIFQMCRPVWRRFFEAAVLSGRLVVPGEERGNMRRLLRAEWQPPGFEYVQPEVEVKAAVRKIRAGLSSRTRELHRLGIDAQELDREIKKDNERAAALGLVLDSDPGAEDEVTTKSEEGEAGGSASRSAA